MDFESQPDVEKKCDKQQTKTDKYVQDTKAYFEKHVFNEHGIIRRHVSSLNEHRAIENTTNHDADFESQPNVEQKCDIQQTETEKYVHVPNSHFEKHVLSKHRRIRRHASS